MNFNCKILRKYFVILLIFIPLSLLIIYALRNKESGINIVENTRLLSSKGENLFAGISNNNSGLSASIKEKKNLISKEYKLLLKGESFSDRLSGVRNICNIIENNLTTYKQSVKFVRDISWGKQRVIEYLDTKSQDLRANNLILRKRVKVKKKHDINELTLKIRLDNPEFSDFSTLSDNNYIVKFDEDILIQIKDSVSLKKIFTASYSVKNTNAENENKIRNYIKIFPQLSDFKINNNAEVSPVNDTKINEDIVKIGYLDFGNDITTEVEIAIWCKANLEVPFIAEISYRLEIPKDKPEFDEIFGLSDNFLKFLYSNMSGITITDKTKTDILYDNKLNIKN